MKFSIGGINFKLFENREKVKKKDGKKKKKEVKEIDGTLGLMDNEDLNRLTKFLLSWYRRKYSGDCLVTDKNGNTKINKENPYNAKTMDFDKLYWRLSAITKESLKTDYISDYSSDDEEINAYITSTLDTEFNGDILSIPSNDKNLNCTLVLDKTNKEILQCFVSGKNPLDKNILKIIKDNLGNIFHYTVFDDCIGIKLTKQFSEKKSEYIISIDKRSRKILHCAVVHDHDRPKEIQLDEMINILHRDFKGKINFLNKNKYITFEISKKNRNHVSKCFVVADRKTENILSLIDADNIFSELVHHKINGFHIKDLEEMLHYSNNDNLHYKNLSDFISKRKNNCICIYLFVENISNYLSYFVTNKLLDECIIVADKTNGRILKVFNEEMLPGDIDKTNLDNLFIQLKDENIQNLNFSYLEECVERHNNDVKMVNQIIPTYEALNLIYNPIEDDDKNLHERVFVANQFLNTWHQKFGKNSGNDYNLPTTTNTAKMKKRKRPNQ